MVKQIKVDLLIYICNKLLFIWKQCSMVYYKKEFTTNFYLYLLYFLRTFIVDQFLIFQIFSNIPCIKKYFYQWRYSPHLWSSSLLGRVKV